MIYGHLNWKKKTRKSAPILKMLPPIFDIPPMFDILISKPQSGGHHSNQILLHSVLQICRIWTLDLSTQVMHSDSVSLPADVSAYTGIGCISPLFQNIQSVVNNQQNYKCLYTHSYSLLEAATVADMSTNDKSKPL